MATTPILVTKKFSFLGIDRTGATNSEVLITDVFGQEWLADFEVERLETRDGRVEAVQGRREGAPMTIRGRIVVLAAGALSSPLVLLRSTSPEWPQGLGNGSGLVGRGLVFHFIQIFALWPSRPLPAAG